MLAGLETQLAGIHAAIPATISRVQTAAAAGVAGAVEAQVPGQLSLLTEGTAAAGAASTAAATGVRSMATAEKALAETAVITTAAVDAQTGAFARLNEAMGIQRARQSSQTFLNLQGALQGLGQGALSSRLAFFGLEGTIVAIGAAIAAIGVTQAGRLERALHTLQIVTQGTADEMGRASVVARQLGADVKLPATTAASAADAMVLLARAGLNVKDSIEGARGVITLAAAAQTDQATAALTVARNLNAFNLAGTQATKVADLLAGASITGGTSIQEMADALSSSAAAAHQLGIPIQDLVTTLAEVARKGLQGEQGGTALRNALIRLAAPTAAARRELDALGVSLTDQRGNFVGLPNLFEQFRVALQGLTPVQQQSALATIFGTRAFRAIALAAQDGKAGFDLAAASTERQGIASDLAAAKMSGFLGQLTALGSTLQSIAGEFGQFAIGPLEDLLTILNGLATAFDTLIIKAKQFADEVSRIHVPKPLGDFIKGFVAALPGVGQLHQAAVAIKAIGDSGETAAEKLQRTRLAAVQFNAAISNFNQILGPTVEVRFPSTGDIQTQVEQLRNTLKKGGVAVGDDFVSALERQLGLIDPRAASRALDKLIIEASTAGKNVGEALGLAIGEGLRDADTKAVNEARTTLQHVIQAGNDAVQQAVVSAKQNLASLGDTLASQIAQLIDAGPLGQQIQRLQDRINSITTKQQSESLKQGLKQAQQDLADAQKQIIIIGKPTAAQQAAIEAFLAPFRQRVKDAQQNIALFNLQGQVTTTQKNIDAIKKASAQGVEDLITEFNSHKITWEQLNAGIAKILETKGIPNYKQAGKTLGLTFVSAFTAELQGISDQASQILAAPSRPGIPANVVNVEKVQAQRLADIEKARDDLQVAIAKKAKDSADSLEVIKRIMLLLEPLIKKASNQAPPPKTKPSPSANGNAGVGSAAAQGIGVSGGLDVGGIGNRARG